jgi:poly(3-hydroxybutyrate) depolymerase
MHDPSPILPRLRRAVSDVARTWLENPIDPLSYTAAGRKLAALAKIFERLTRRYGNPAFDLATTVVGGNIVPIVEVVVWERPFCKLLHFETQFDTGVSEPGQKLLIVAPMSSHHATLLRGTVEAFLPFYDVYKAVHKHGNIQAAYLSDGFW